MTVLIYSKTNKQIEKTQKLECCVHMKQGLSFLFF